MNQYIREQYDTHVAEEKPCYDAQAKTQIEQVRIATYHAKVKPQAAIQA